MAKGYLSIDIGGTNLKSGYFTETGQLVETNKIPTPQKLDSFTNEIKQLIKQYQAKIQGVAFSVPGKTDYRHSIVYFGGSLPFLDNLNFQELVHQVDSALKVHIENDGKAAALAEYWQGSLKGSANCAAIVLGTGVGGGIIVNGQLLRGAHLQGAELSFMVGRAENANEPTLFGELGSAVHMISQAAEALKLQDLKAGEPVFAAINDQDPRVLPIFKKYCHHIAELILNIQSVVDLDTIAIGGGISAQDSLITTIRSEYTRLLNELPLVKSMLTRPNITTAHFHNQANLYGALYGLIQTQQ